MANISEALVGSQNALVFLDTLAWTRGRQWLAYLFSDLRPAPSS
ncbi:hypothetical protein ABH908_002267 [Pseudomonas frederiksbergensis]